MRVFVSSTVYDLVDIRGELEQLLRELGISPVMSDHKLSDFDLAFQANFDSVVPEPSTYVMLATGLLALGFVAWRRRGYA